MIDTLEIPPSRNRALDGLKTLDLSDLPRWKLALENGRSRGFGNYFPFVLAHERAGKTVMLVTEDAGSLCVFIRRERKRGPRLDLFLNPIPMDVAVTQRCIERVNQFNGNRSARIMRIDEKDAPLVAQVPGLKISERRKQYLFEPRAFTDLSGGKYQTLRSHLARIRKLPDLEVVPYSDRFATDCRALLQRWSERYRGAFGTSGGYRLSKQALDLADQMALPDMTGEVVRVEGRVVAYCLGGEIRRGLGCFLDAKSDLDLPGLGYFQRYSFYTQHAFDLINDGSDARRPGLRQMKDSLRPVAMHLEFRAKQVSE